MLKKIAIAGVLAAALPLPALADPYLLLGGATGTVDLDNIQNAYPAASSADDTVNRAIVGVGGRVNQFVGVEATYMTKTNNNVHDNLGHRDNFNHDGFQLALLGFVPLAQNIDLFGKVSANILNTEYNTNFGPSYYSETHNDTHLGFGGGVEFNVSRNATVRAEIEQIQIRNVVNSNVINGNPGDFNVTQGSLNLLVYF